LEHAAKDFVPTHSVYAEANVGNLEKQKKEKNNREEISMLSKDLYWI